MGNVVTLEALRQMAIRDGRVTPKIRNVVLAAPDVDVDLAREAVSNMGPNRPNVTLLVSQEQTELSPYRAECGAVRSGWAPSTRIRSRTELI